MADDKKKDLSALKARLKAGKTGAVGAPAVGRAVPPPGAVAKPGGVVPPPGGVVPPLGGVPKPGAVPIPAALGGKPGLGGVAPPPFAKPAAPRGPDLSRDPFAVARSTGPGELRIVIDERISVDDKETGRKTKLSFFVTIAVALATLSFGYCGGNAMKDRIIFNRSIRDAREIKEVVESSAKVLGGAKARVQQAINLANTKKQADIPSVEYLRSLKKPIDAGSFSRRNYIAFEVSTVDSLFAYYNGINKLWDQFQGHVARTFAERESLEQSRERIEQLSTTDYCVAFRLEQGNLLGQLAILEVPDGAEPGTILIRPRAGTPGAPRHVMYLPEEAESGQEVGEGLNCITRENFADLAIPLHPENRSGLLASTVAPFRDYAGRLARLNAAMTELTEIQTRLMSALSDLSNLEDLATIGE